MKKEYLLTVVALLLFCGMLSAQQITISTTPQGSGVYYNGKKIGTTPLKITPETKNAPDFFSRSKPSFDLIIMQDFFESELLTVSWDGKSPVYTVRLKPISRLPLYNGRFQNRERLSVEDLVFLSLENLARLREEVYAQHGRPIQDKRFTAEFKKTRWYRENPMYDESMLTGNDKYNIGLINDFLEVNDVDVALFKALLKKYEFKTENGKVSIRFINARECTLAQDDPDGYALESYVPYYSGENWNFQFFVAGGRIFIAPPNRRLLYEVFLDLENKTINDIVLIDEL